MDIRIQYLPSELNEWQVTKIIAETIHSDDFNPRSSTEERLVNFKVRLNRNESMGVRSDGTGVLTLPTTAMGGKFLRYIYDHPIKIEKKKIKFTKLDRPPFRGLAMTLEKTPYTSPDIEEERKRKIDALQEELRVDAVQFGAFYRSSYPKQSKPTPREYSIEWNNDYTRMSTAWLRFEYDHKLIRIEVSDLATGLHNLVSYSSSSATK